MRARSAGTAILILLLVLTAGWSRSPGVDVTFTGRVLDADTGRPVPSAQVRVEGRVRVEETSLGTLTDSRGRYAIPVPKDALRAGSPIRVVAERIGYARGETEVRIGSTEISTGGTVRADIQLRPVSVSLDEVTVTGEPTRAGGPPSVSMERARTASFSSRSHRSFAPTRHPNWNREQYDHIEENAFLGVEENPLSTLSIDVDRASYSNVRRFLLSEGRLPPVDAVRVEEMVNYFSYDYALPNDEHPLAVTTEVGSAPWHRNHLLLRIGLASPPVETRDLPPSNFVFLLDVSGSMQPADKLPLVKEAIRMLVDQLRPNDRVAIVVYAGAAGLVLQPTPGSEKERILDAIEDLEAGGSTAGGAGLRLAYRVARKNFLEKGNNRVILATDGDFNVGPSSDSEMVRLIEEKRREGTFLTILGVGTGNLQSEKMQSLAQHGNGNYAYIDSRLEARKVLVNEMGGTLLTVAQDVKIQVEFNPARVTAYRLIGYENRLMADEDFNDDTKDAGDLGAGHTVTALYEVLPVGVESEVTVRGTDLLRYREPPGVTDRASTDELAFVRVRYKEPRSSESRLLEHPIRRNPECGRDPVEMEAMSSDLRFAAAVAGFGMLLRESEHRGSISVRQVLSLARAGLGEDPDGYRRGFLDLVRAYRSLAPDVASDGVRQEGSSW